MEILLVRMISIIVLSLIPISGFSADNLIDAEEERIPMLLAEVTTYSDNTILEDKAYQISLMKILPFDCLILILKELDLTSLGHFIITCRDHFKIRDIKPISTIFQLIQEQEAIKSYGQKKNLSVIPLVNMKHFRFVHDHIQLFNGNLPMISELDCSTEIPNGEQKVQHSVQNLRDQLVEYPPFHLDEFDQIESVIAQHYNFTSQPSKRECCTYWRALIRHLPLTLTAGIVLGGAYAFGVYYFKLAEPIKGNAVDNWAWVLNNSEDFINYRGKFYTECGWSQYDLFYSDSDHKFCHVPCKYHGGEISGNLTDFLNFAHQYCTTDYTEWQGIVEDYLQNWYWGKSFLQYNISDDHQVICVLKSGNFYGFHKESYAVQKRNVQCIYDTLFDDARSNWAAGFWSYSMVVGLVTGFYWIITLGSFCYS